LDGVPVNHGIGWDEGRATWIKSFLARKRIFHGPNMADCERTARHNLLKELDQLVPAPDDDPGYGDFS
jgi:predicted metal-dependent HD superfamily phosphohydrolase